MCRSAVKTQTTCEPSVRAASVSRARQTYWPISRVSVLVCQINKFKKIPPKSRIWRQSQLFIGYFLRATKNLPRMTNKWRGLHLKRNQMRKCRGRFRSTWIPCKTSKKSRKNKKIACIKKKWSLSHSELNKRWSSFSHHHLKATIAAPASRNYPTTSQTTKIP
jgi:hypothetical protein